MPNLAQFTDAYDQPDSMPVEPLDVPKRLIMNMNEEGTPKLEEPAPANPGWSGSDEDKQRAMNLLYRKSTNQPIDKEGEEFLNQYMKWVDKTSAPIPATTPDPRPEPMPDLSGVGNGFLDIPFSAGTDIGNRITNRLTGMNGEERYQLWPEKVVRSALTALPDAAAGKLPVFLTDPTTGEQVANPEAVARTLDMASLGGAGGLATGATDATLGSAPFLRPALKYEGKIYKAPPGGEHLDALPAHLADEFQRQAMSGEDISNFNFGFMNHKGQFLSREAALDYGIKEGLIDPHAGKYGTLTSTLLADSSKPGTAIEAMAKSNPFYSAVEHQVNAIPQAKMTGEQWLGTLSNKPGVKPEEMQWTGLQDFLKEKGKEPVTKAEVQEHLANNKVELKEVGKGGNVTPEDIKAAKDAYKEFEDYSEVLAEKYNLNPQQNLSMYGRIKNMDPAEIAKYDELHHRYIETKKATEANNTKHHSYQLPGGENYKELLLTLPRSNRENTIPSAKATAKYQSQWDELVAERRRLQPLVDDYNRRLTGEAWEKAKADFAEVNKKMDDLHYKMVDETMKENPAKYSNQDFYVRSHWDEPNILAHIRMNDRIIEGKKSLHLEEIQSDWHQQGRDRGYRVKPEYVLEGNGPWTVRTKDGRFIDDFNNKQLAEKRLKSLQEDTGIDSGLETQVPDAPFKKTEAWASLALKRMIREAAEKGYDRLSWTPGEAQAARYDLSKTVKKVHYDPDLQGGTLAAEGLDGRTVLDKQGIKPDQIADYVGKDVAKKLLETTRNKDGIHSLEGLDLKIGGEWTKKFYDEMIPKFLQKISGEKVKTYSPKEVKASPEEINKLAKTLYETYDRKGGEPPWEKLHPDQQEYYKVNAREKSYLVDNPTPPVHYIDIPQQLKDKAMHKGFPLFSGGFMFTPVTGNPFDATDKK